MTFSTWSKSAVVLLLCSVVGACTHSTNLTQSRVNYFSHELTEPEIVLVQSDVLAYLKSGEGLFSGIKAAENKTGDVAVCGWVRQRDYDFDYRRFPLNRPFAASYKRRDGRLGDFRLIYFANEKHEAPRLYSYCRRHGIPL